MGRDQPTLDVETLSKNNQENSRNIRYIKSRKMKSTFTILIAVLAIVSVSSKVLLPGDFSVKKEQSPVVFADTTVNPDPDTTTVKPDPEDTTTGNPDTTTNEEPDTTTTTEPDITTGAAAISVKTFLVLLSAISMKL